jgi:hypothetical protein
VQDYLTEWLMTLGRAPGQADLFRTTVAYCDGRVPPESIYGILHRECFSLFPDEMHDAAPVPPDGGDAVRLVEEQEQPGCGVRTGLCSASQGTPRAGGH